MAVGSKFVTDAFNNDLQPTDLPLSMAEMKKKLANIVPMSGKEIND